MTATAKDTWPGFFNPNDPKLWAMGSDVDWIYGDYIYDLGKTDTLHLTQPWIVRTEQSATKLVRENAQTVLSLLGALMAWRVTTVSQMQAGLAPNAEIPTFYRDIPTIYGAMVRLGLIDVGFSPRERLEGIEVPQVWLSLGKRSKLVRRIDKILADKITGTDQWITRTLFSGTGFFSRRHARHNTFAAHAALTASRNSRVKLVTGDGWGAFRRIDQRACDEANLTGLSATDVVILSHSHTTCCLEVQAAGLDNKSKLQNWINFLSKSPMSRRGILCIWLTIPNVSGIQPNLTNDLMAAGRTPTASIGMPSVGQRIGIAKWDEWFDELGLPTSQFGTYTDLFGERRDMLTGWDASTPHEINDISSVGNWGWEQVRTHIARKWGLNTGSWRMPEFLRGGFYGFTEGVDNGE